MQKLAMATALALPTGLSVSQAEESASRCQQCEGSGWIVIVGSGAKKCECLKQKIRKTKLDRIPGIYQGMSLATITPDPSRHVDQAVTLKWLQDNPEASYAFTGNLTASESPNAKSNRVGKSMFGWLLYREAVERNQRACGLLLSDLLKQFQAWELNPDKVPDITPGDLRQNHTRYFLLIDELDKDRPTEFRAEVLFQLIEAAHSFKHQLVVTTNYTLDGLAQYWSRNGAAYGPAIVSRIKEQPGGWEIPMF
jgi:hypothetical protein